MFLIVGCEQSAFTQGNTYRVVYFLCLGTCIHIMLGLWVSQLLVGSTYSVAPSMVSSSLLLYFLCLGTCILCWDGFLSYWLVLYCCSIHCLKQSPCMYVQSTFLHCPKSNANFRDITLNVWENEILQ